MGQLFSYSLIVGILLCCGYVVYKWILSSERQHSYNRMIIYVIYLLAFILPFFIHFLNPFPLWKAQGGIEIGRIAGGSIAEGENFQSDGINIRMLLLAIYVLGMAIMFLYSLISAVVLSRIVSQGDKYRYNGITLVISDKEGIAPFSWLRYIVINRNDVESGADVIITHEKRHLQLFHWVDLLFAQLVVIFQWYNPAAWLLREEFQIVHEYQADEAVMTSGVNIHEYQMLLIKKAVGARFQSLANSLNHSKLKKRITMMYKEKSSVLRRCGALLLVPAMAVGCMLVQIPAFAGFLESESAATLFPTAERKVSKKTSHTVFIKPGKEQAESTLDNQSSAETPNYAVDKLAEPKEGMAALLKFLHDNLHYPEEAVKANITGKVIVKFVVEKDGTVSDPQIVRSVDRALDQEALRVIGLMPRWNPAKVKGEPVRTYYVLPVSFSLPDSSAAK